MGGAPAVVGIAEHRGWAIVVCVAARAGAPVVLDRRRVELVGADLSSQPHHHGSGRSSLREGAELEVAQAEALVREVEGSVAAHARTALSQLQADLGAEHRLVSIALQRGPRHRRPATFAEILESQNAMIAADGDLYRDRLCAAAEELGIAAELIPRKEESECAAQALGVDVARLETLLRELGRGLGPPWRKEHRSAAAAAISVLAQHTRLDPLGPSA